MTPVVFLLIVIIAILVAPRECGDMFWWFIPLLVALFFLPLVTIPALILFGLGYWIRKMWIRHMMRIYLERHPDILTKQVEPFKG